MEDPEVKVLVTEVRELSIDEIAAQTRSQKAAVKSKLRGRHRELPPFGERKEGKIWRKK